MNQELKQFLTHDEVAALQEAISSGKVTDEEEEVAGDGSIISFDFSRYQSRSSKHLYILDRICDRFGRVLKATFLTRFGVAYTVNTDPLGAMSFKEFLGILPPSTCTVLMNITPPGGPALLTMDAHQAHFFIDRLCGGSGVQNMDSDAAEFHEIGQSLVRRVTHYILDDLEKAWHLVSPARIELAGLQFNLRYFEATAPDELQSGVLEVVTVEMKSDSSEGKIYLGLPRSTLQPLLQEGTPKVEEATLHVEPMWASAIKDRLSDVNVDLAVELGTGDITLKKFLSLKKGDIIQLNRNVAEELVVKVEGIVKLKGHPGRYRNHRALQVSTPLTERSEG